MADQELDIPFAGGLDQAVEPKITAKLISAVNCRYEKEGGLISRYGNQCIGPYNKRLDTTTPGTCDMLTTFRKELVRIGAGRLDTFRVVGTTSDWIGKGYTPPFCVERVDIAAGPLTQDADIAIAGTTAAFVTFQQTGSVFSLILDAFDTTTGAALISSQIIYSGELVGSDVPLCPKVVATSSTTIAIVWMAFNLLGATLKGAVLDTSTMTVGSVVSMVTSRANSLTLNATPGFDIGVFGGSLFSFTEAASGTNRLQITKFNAALSATSTFTITSSTDTGVSSFALFGDGTTIHAAWGFVTHPAQYEWYVKTVGVTTGLVSVYTSATVDFQVNRSIIHTPLSLSGCVLSSTKALVTWTLSTPTVLDSNASIKPATRTVRSSRWQEITRTNGATTYSASRLLDQFLFLSRPVYTTGDAHATVYGINMHSTHSTGFFARLPVLDGSSQRVSANIGAVTLPRQCFNSYASSSSHVSSIVTDSAGKQRLAAVYDVGDISIYTNTGAACLILDSTRPTISAIESGDLLLLAGGVPSIYDGTGVSEIGFPWEPDVATLTQIAGGNIPDGTYRYLLIFSWVDASGNLHQSGPSPLTNTMRIQVTGGGGSAGVRLSIRPLTITNKTAADATINTIQVDVYRTLAGGASYYYVGNVPNNSYANQDTFLTYDDVSSDATIQVNAPPYTLGISGEELPNRILPSCRYVVPYKGSVVFGGSDDDTLWFSKPQVPGYGPGFNGQLIQDPFEGGPVTALASQDDVLYPFKENSVWSIAGDPPVGTGASSMGLPQRVPAQVGCINHASLALVPVGTLFQTRDAYYILTRGGSVAPIGAAVEDSISESTLVCAATLVGHRRCLRAALRDSYKVFVLDLHNQGTGQDPEWTEEDYPDVQTGTWVGGAITVAPSNASIRGAAYWNGRYVWISSAGYLYGEIDQRVDKNYAGDLAPITVSGTLGVTKLSGLQGYTRCRKVGLLFESSGSIPIRLRLATDYASTYQSRSWTGTEVAAMTLQQVQIHPHPQKCEAFQILFDTSGQTTVTSNDTFKVLGIRATVDINRGQNRIKPAQVR